MTIRVAGAQLPVTNDVSANVAGISRAIAFARTQKADILLTPEGSLSGYRRDFDLPAVNEALRYVTRLAHEARVGLALGTCFCEPDDGKYYNQIRFYLPDGKYLGFHSKTLLGARVNTDPPEGELNHFAIRPLRIYGFGDIRVGGLICNDLWANPEWTPQPDTHLAWQLARLGARIIFHAVNGGRDDSEWSQVAWQYHESNLRLRARAAGVWIVTADSSHPVHWRCSAPSGVLSPDGQWACRAEPKGEQLFAHTIDLS